MTTRTKTIAYASTDRIEAFKQIASDFMLEIFELMPGDYVISDESSLRDFTAFGSFDTAEIWRLINESYDIARDQVRSEKLIDVFSVIEQRRRTH